MSRSDRADRPGMVFWPVAALAVLLLGFVVLYGSTLQARIDARSARPSDDSDS